MQTSQTTFTWEECTHTCTKITWQQFGRIPTLGAPYEGILLRAFIIIAQQQSRPEYQTNKFWREHRYARASSLIFLYSPEFCHRLSLELPFQILSRGSKLSSTHFDRCKQKTVVWSGNNNLQSAKSYYIMFHYNMGIELVCKLLKHLHIKDNYFVLWAQEILIRS